MSTPRRSQDSMTVRRRLFQEGWDLSPVSDISGASIPWASANTILRNKMEKVEVAVEVSTWRLETKIRKLEEEVETSKECLKKACEEIKKLKQERRTVYLRPRK